MDKRNKTDTIVIHCTQTPKDMDIDVAKVTEWHTQRGFDTIGYHYLIKRDGTLEKGRDESMVGSHARAVNGTSLGICLIGGSNKSGDWENNFNDEQFETLLSIVKELKDKYNINKVIGHYEVDDVKKCPSFDVKEWLDKHGISNT